MDAAGGGVTRWLAVAVTCAAVLPAVIRPSLFGQGDQTDQADPIVKGTRERVAASNSRCGSGGGGGSSSTAFSKSVPHMHWKDVLCQVQAQGRADQEPTHTEPGNQHRGCNLDAAVGHRREDYLAVAQWRVPVVVKGSIIEEWAAMHKWSFEYILDLFPWAMVHQQAQPSFVTFHDNRALEKVIRGTKWKDFNIMKNVSTKTVVHRGRQDEYMYFSSSLSRLARSSQPSAKEQKGWLAGGKGPLNLEHDLVLSPLLLGGEGAKFQANLWLGDQGIITHSHYDAQFNFFFQLRGRKRVTLIPPGDDLLVYPCLHPHYGSLFPAPRVAATPQQELEGQQTCTRMKRPTWVTELTPGDLLVIPPFWFHHVHTTEKSMSLNVWSDAPELTLMDQVYAAPIPFEAEWDKRTMVLAIHAYLSALVEAVLDPHHRRGTGGVYGSRLVVPFVQEYLVQNRYAGLLATMELPWAPSAWALFSRNRSRSLCSGGHFQMQRLGEQLWGGGPINQSFQFDRGLRVIVPLFDKIARAAQPLGSSTHRIESEAEDQGSATHTSESEAEDQQVVVALAITKLLLGNYVEHVISILLDATSVYPFLANCFSPAETT